MCFGSTTKVVPTESTSNTQVEIPPWLNQAGQMAVDKATDLVNTPYTGDLVAPTNANQDAAASVAQQGAQAGQAITSTGSGALQTAGNLAGQYTGAGQPSAAAGGGLYAQAGLDALDSQTAGQFGYGIAGLGTTGQSALAAQSANAGQDQLATATQGAGDEIGRAHV